MDDVPEIVIKLSVDLKQIFRCNELGYKELSLKSPFPWGQLNFAMTESYQVTELQSPQSDSKGRGYLFVFKAFGKPDHGILVVLTSLDISLEDLFYVQKEAITLLYARES